MNYPIAIFAYRRVDLLKDLLDVLLCHPQIADFPIYVFCDGAKSDEEAVEIDSVRRLCRSISGVKSLTLCFRETNMGCAANIIDGVTRVLADYPAVIVIEDDLIVSPHFIDYMVLALSCYQSRQDVFSVSGFSPKPKQLGVVPSKDSDTYLSRRNSSWGWGTWADRWRKVDWDVSDYQSFISDSQNQKKFNLGGNDLTGMLNQQMHGLIDSWSIRFSYAHYKHQAYSVCPYWSYIDHLGNDGLGTHVKYHSGIEVDLFNALAHPRFNIEIEPDIELLEALRKFNSESMISQWLSKIPYVTKAVRTMKESLGIKRRIL